MIYLVSNQTRIFEDTSILQISVERSLEILAPFSQIEFDTETTGLDAHTCRLLSMQFGNINFQVVVDCTTISPLKYKKLLEDKSKTFLMQNAKFDLKFLYRYMIVPHNVYDTMLGESVIHSGDRSKRKSLDVITERYLGFRLDKTVRGSIHKEGLSERVIKYAADDVKYLGEIKKHQDKILKETGMTLALDLDNMYVKVLAYIEYCGMYMDSESWKFKCKLDMKHMDIWAGLLDRHLNSLFDKNPKLKKFQKVQYSLDLFGEEDRKVTINWSSPTQVLDVLGCFDIKPVVMDKKTKKMKYSVESGVLKKYKKELDKALGKDFLRLYLKYKASQKTVTTYGKNFFSHINPITGRIHTKFNQLMNTGRLSSGGKDRALRVDFINFQNIPRGKYTRGRFVAQRASNTLVCADYSSQESVVLTNLSNESNLIEFYTNGEGDLHTFVAKLLYPAIKDCTVKEVKTKHSEKRQTAKSANFALAYGGDGYTLSKNLDIPIAEGKEIYNKYFDAFPGLKDYFNKCSDEALQKGYVVLSPVSGRRTYFPQHEEYKTLKSKRPAFGTEEGKKLFRMKGSMTRDSINYPIQGTSAEMTKLAQVLFFDELRKRDLLFTVLIPNVVHDEILIECPKKIAQEMSDLLQECMEKAGRKFCKTIPVAAEPMISSAWEH